MKLCFPVEKNEGLQSQVFGHFGSAPVFLLVDTEADGVTEVSNRDLHHAHGACSPVRALGGQAVDAVIVGGIGGGALGGLTRAGVRVFKAETGTVAHNVARMKDRRLTPWTSDQVCGGHGHGRGCGH